MKLQIFLLSTLFTLSHLMGASADHGVYYGELKALKVRPDSKIIFDKEANGTLRFIRRNIEICKNVSFVSKILQIDFLSCEVAVVTSDTMPRLYEYIEKICSKNGIVVPTIFVTQEKKSCCDLDWNRLITNVKSRSSFLSLNRWIDMVGTYFYANSFCGDPSLRAMARKILMHRGTLVIGQQLLYDVCDEELEAIIAYEIGHIKHNHFNKTVVVLSFEFFLTASLADYLQVPEVVSFDSIKKMDGRFLAVMVSKMCCAYMVPRILSAFINKRFERQADLCSLQVASQGFIKFFERLKKEEQLLEEEFISTYNILQQSKSCISSFDYGVVSLMYYWSKAVHLTKKGYMYVCHNTLLGAHPSHQARIDAAKEYLAQQQA